MEDYKKDFNTKCNELIEKIENNGKKTELKCDEIIKRIDESSNHFCANCDKIILGQEKIMDMLNKMPKKRE